jgi:predicted dehydrogenase
MSRLLCIELNGGSGLTVARRIGMGLVGPGFIAPHHIDAVRRLGDVDVCAIAGSTLASTRERAAQLGVARYYGSYEDLVSDPEIEVVHNTTPNYMHFAVSMAAIEAGKHIISDKPLALTSLQCCKLRDAAEAAGVVNAVTFNYRGNPLLQQARAMVDSGEIGPVFFVHGQYLQDWMADDHVYSWRMDPEKGGDSSALADIGSHWCDLAEHVTGSRIVEVLAEMTTVVRTRYSSGASGKAFAQGESGAARTPIAMKGEDLASVLLRFENGARGSVSVGQVIPGHKNDLTIEVSGRSGSLHWRQERQNELWIGRYDRPNSLMDKDPSLLLPEARSYARLPGGHQEGWADAFFQIIRDIYSYIRAGGDAAMRPATLCSFADATRICALVEAMVASHTQGGVWRSVAEVSEEE